MIKLLIIFFGWSEFLEQIIGQPWRDRQTYAGILLQSEEGKSEKPQHTWKEHADIKEDGPFARGGI